MRLWAFLALSSQSYVAVATTNDNEVSHPHPKRSRIIRRDKDEEDHHGGDLHAEIRRDRRKGTCVLKGVHGVEGKRKGSKKVEFFCVNRDTLTHHVADGSLKLKQWYDTGVHCRRCLGEYPITHHKKHLPLTSTYGPENCIHTYLSPDNTCIVETKKCPAESVLSTNVGFLCAKSKPAQMVRHYFGTNSFKSSQAIDTGISCDQCLSSDISIQPGEEHVADHSAYVEAKSLWLLSSTQSLAHRITALVQRFDQIMDNKTEFLKEKKRLSHVLTILPDDLESRDAGNDDGGLDLNEW